MDTTTFLHSRPLLPHLLRSTALLRRSPLSTYSERPRTCMTSTTRIPPQPLPGEQNTSDVASLYSAPPTPSSSSTASSSTASSPDSNDTSSPPLEYSRQALETYWSARSAQVRSRWANFLREAAPFFTNLLRQYSLGTLSTEQGLTTLAKDARERLERLGPTYVKMGQMLSVRADVVPKGVREELSKLQDSVKGFEWEEAKMVMEEEFGYAIENVFEYIEKTPVAAASLAQVYRGKLKSGEEVAVKVQRNKVRESVGSDLYVLIKAVGIWEGIVKRWSKQQVDYDALVDKWAEGFYGELDFEKEAQVQMKARDRILKCSDGLVYVPKVYEKLCSRRVMVSEFCNGKRLTELEDEEIRELIPIGQECFLKQLLEYDQYFHCDPHGGNLLKNIQNHPSYVDEDDPRRKAKLILLDFGLVTTIPEEDKGKIVLTVVHMANSDWAAVTNDMIELGFLPKDTDQALVTPLLEKILAPYVLGGGGVQGYISQGKKMSRKTVQALINDLNSAATEIPFSISPYWPIIGRAVAILEGIALQGNPSYNIVMSSYPYMAKRLLRDSTGSTSFRSALNEVLYPGGGVGAKRKRPNPRRLAVLLNNALGVIASTNKNRSLNFVDFDALPDSEESISFQDTLKLLASKDGQAVRDLVLDELATGLDLLTRQLIRRAATLISQPPTIRLPTPSISFMPIPLPSPKIKLPHVIGVIPESVREATLERIAPRLSPEEDVFLGDLKEVTMALLGISAKDIGEVMRIPSDPADVFRMATKGLRNMQEGRLPIETKGLEKIVPVLRPLFDEKLVSNAKLLQLVRLVLERYQEIQQTRMNGSRSTSQVPK